MVTSKFDVVISFTEQQKDIAVGIRLALENLNISCYYYCYEPEENIGKDLRCNLQQIYMYQGLLAIAIISNEYLNKEITKIELRAILKRREQDPDYLVPVQYNNTPMPAAIEGVTYFEWKKDPKAIANIVYLRLQKKSDGLLERDPYRLSNMDKALLAQIINRFSTYDNNSAEFHYRMGLHYFYLNLSKEHFEKAAVHFKKAIAVNPSLHEAYYYLSKAIIFRTGIQLIRFAEIKPAIEALKTALALSSGKSEYYLWVGEIEEKFYKRHGIKSPFK